MAVVADTASEPSTDPMDALSFISNGDSASTKPTMQHICSFCGYPSDTVRCKRCESCRVRIYRAVKGDEELEEKWSDLKDKGKILAKAGDLYGDTLFKVLRTSLEEESCTKSELSFKGTGQFMDEDDIRDKYKNKPRRLEAVLKFA